MFCIVGLAATLPDYQDVVPFCAAQILGYSTVMHPAAICALSYLIM